MFGYNILVVLFTEDNDLNFYIYKIFKDKHFLPGEISHFLSSIDWGLLHFAVRGYDGKLCTHECVQQWQL